MVMMIVMIIIMMMMIVMLNDWVVLVDIDIGVCLCWLT